MDSKKIKNGNQKYIIVHGIQIPDKALTNLELSKYCEELNITSLRGIFARDSLQLRATTKRTHTQTLPTVILANRLAILTKIWNK